MYNVTSLAKKREIFTLWRSGRRAGVDGPHRKPAARGEAVARHAGGAGDAECQSYGHGRARPRCQKRVWLVSEHGFHAPVPSTTIRPCTGFESNFKTQRTSILPPILGQHWSTMICTTAVASSTSWHCASSARSACSRRADAMRECPIPKFPGRYSKPKKILRTSGRNARMPHP